MRVTLLGTGAADGWPNPWCGCASCRWARVEPGRVRTHTAALLDGTVLVDCGPDVARQADRAGPGLAGVRAVLLTHAHWDHADPAALLTRAWAERREPLQVLGPASALARFGQWRGADLSEQDAAPASGHGDATTRAPSATDGIELRVLAPGDEAEVAGYRVRALAAAHQPRSTAADVLTDADVLTAEALLYDITGTARGCCTRPTPARSRPRRWRRSRARRTTSSCSTRRSAR